MCVLLILPCILQYTGKVIRNCISDNMHQKLASWKANNLSLAGGITSCRSVLAKIPLYPLQAALLHKLICSEIERICRGFIWADSEGRRGSHLIKWKAICKPKEEGGLGTCDMRTMNKAFTMKLIWVSQ